MDLCMLPLQPTEASAATSSADSQTRERTSQAYVALRRLWRGQFFAVMILLVWSETSGVGSILIGGANPKKTGLAGAEFCRGCGPGTTQSSSHLADGVEVAGRQRGDLCQDRRGFEPGTRATARRLPTSSKTWTPSFGSFSLAPRTRAWLLYWRRRNRSATSSRYSCSRYSCRTTSPSTVASAWPRRRGRRPARFWKSPSRKRRTSWSFWPSSVRKSMSPGHASAAQQCRTVGAEMSDGGGQCRAVPLRIAKSPDGGRAALAGPVGGGVSQLPQRRSAGRFQCLLQGARAKPRLKEAGSRHPSVRPRLLPRRRQAKLELLRRSRSPGQPGWTRTSHRLRPCPGGGPAPVLASMSVLVHMAGAVGVPQFPQFAMISDACPWSMDPHFFKGQCEEAQLGLPVPSCPEDTLNSTSGAQAGSPVAQTFSAFAVARPEQCGATAATLRNALSLGDCALGTLRKDIPECAQDEVCAWGYAGDEEAFTNILIGTITDTWSQPRDAGWAIVVLSRRIGESFGDVPLPSDREDYVWVPSSHRGDGGAHSTPLGLLLDNTTPH